MQLVRSGQDNTVGFDVVTRSSNEPVTEGVTVAMYLVARSGANAGKWWDGSAWSATEAAAATAAHESRGHWVAEIDAEAWTAGVSYRLYGVAEDDDYIVHSTDVLCLTSTGGWPEAAGDYPVSVAEVKDWLRLDIEGSEEDALLGACIAAATEWAEQYNGRTFLAKTRVEVFDSFPREFRPRHVPLLAMTSIEYVDDSGDLQTLDPAEYQVDTLSDEPRIQPAYGKSWPSTRGVLNAVTLTYVAGYGTEPTDVPQGKRVDIARKVGELYENREATSPLAMHKVPLPALSIDRRIPV